MIYEGELLAIGTVAEIRHHRDPLIHRFLYADFKPNSPEKTP